MGNYRLIFEFLYLLDEEIHVLSELVVWVSNLKENLVYQLARDAILQGLMVCDVHFLSSYLFLFDSYLFIFLFESSTPFLHHSVGIILQFQECILLLYVLS